MNIYIIEKIANSGAEPLLGINEYAAFTQIDDTEKKVVREGAIIGFDSSRLQGIASILAKKNLTNIIAAIEKGNGENVHIIEPSNRLHYIDTDEVTHLTQGLSGAKEWWDKVRTNSEVQDGYQAAISAQQFGMTLVTRSKQIREVEINIGDKEALSPQFSYSFPSFRTIKTSNGKNQDSITTPVVCIGFIKAWQGNYFFLPSVYSMPFKLRYDPISKTGTPEVEPWVAITAGTSFRSPSVIPLNYGTTSGEGQYEMVTSFKTSPYTIIMAPPTDGALNGELKDGPVYMQLHDLDGDICEDTITHPTIRFAAHDDIKEPSKFSGASVTPYILGAAMLTLAPRFVDFFGKKKEDEKDDFSESTEIKEIQTKKVTSSCTRKKISSRELSQRNAILASMA